MPREHGSEGTPSILLVPFGWDLNKMRTGPSQRTRNVANAAADLYFSLTEQGYSVYILSTSRGYSQHAAPKGESEFMDEILAKRGVPADRRFVEKESKSTPGNAERGLLCLANTPVLSEQQWGQIYLIADPTHIDRVQDAVLKVWGDMGIPIHKSGKILRIEAENQRQIPVLSHQSSPAQCGPDYGKLFAKHEVSLRLWNGVVAPAGTLTYRMSLKRRMRKVKKPVHTFR